MYLAALQFRPCEHDLTVSKVRAACIQLGEGSCWSLSDWILFVSVRTRHRLQVVTAAGLARGELSPDQTSGTSRQVAVVRVLPEPD